MLDALTTVQTTIGFFTFGLTVLIWVKNYWEALQDIQNAPTQVRDQMPTLRQGALLSSPLMQMKLTVPTQLYMKNANMSDESALPRPETHALPPTKALDP